MTTTDTTRQNIAQLMLVAIICEMLDSAAKQGDSPVGTGPFIMGMMMQNGQHPENTVHGIQTGNAWGLIDFHNVPEPEAPPESISLSAKGAERLAELIGYLDATEPLIKAAQESGEQPDFAAFPPLPTFD